MRASSWLVVLVILGLLASSVVAKEPSRLDVRDFSRLSGQHGPALSTRDVFEGFEIAVPPAGWTSVVNNAETWRQFEVEGGSLEGDFSAYIRWHDTVAQDEVIAFSHTVDVAGGEYVLSFWMAGARESEWDLLATETVEVDGTVVFDFDTAPDPAGYFEWEQRFVDLTAWDGQTVEIAFRYAGLAADAHFLDAVMVDDGTGYTPPPPPDPPENDLCEDAVTVSGVQQFVVDLCTANNDYDADEHGTSCTGWISAGRDVVYRVYLHAGEDFFASVQGDHDASLWLVTDCADPAGTCVIGSDDTIAEGYEQIPPVSDPGWLPTVDGWHYLIVDGYDGGDCSESTIDIDAPIGNAAMDWGRVKTLYR